MPSRNFTFKRDITKDLKWNESAGTYVAALPEYTFTITPIPSDATVVLAASGFAQSGNSITVEEGTEVTYTVSKDGYNTKSGTVAPTSNTIITVTLEEITLDPIDESTTVKELEVNSTVYDIVGKGILDQNSKTTQTEWVGTKAEYDALGVYANYCTYIITDDSAESNADEVGAIAEDINTLKGYDYVVDWQMPSAANGYTWYRKYKSGWVEQGGRLAGDVSYDVTFMVPFSDLDYTASAILLYCHAGTICNIGLTSLTGTGMRVAISDNTQGNDRPALWQASGLAA